MKNRNSQTYGTCIALVAIAVMFLSQQAQAITTILWNNGADWNSGWTGGVAPTSAQAAVFTATPTTQPYLGASSTTGIVQFLTTSGVVIDGVAGAILNIAGNGANGSAGNGSIYSTNATGTNTFKTPINFVSTANAPLVKQVTGGTLILNGIISSSALINMALGSTGNNGTYVFNGVNTYTGTTSFGTGGGSVYTMGNKKAFGESVLNFNGNNLMYVGASTTLTGADAVTNAIRFSGNQAGFGGTNAMEFTGNIDLGGAARTMNIATQGGGLTLGGVISNDGGLGMNYALTSGATLRLTGTNTYTGETRIETQAADAFVEVTSIGSTTTPGALGQGAVLKLGKTASTYSGNLRYLGSGETSDKVLTFISNSGGATFDASGSGALILNGSMNNTTAANKTVTFTGTNADRNTYSGALVDNTTFKTSILKTGAGTWVLSGTSSSTGNTSVRAGKLVIAGSVAGSALTTATSTGILMGTGLVGALTIQDGGVVAPGDGSTPGTLTGGIGTFQNLGALSLQLKNDASGTAGTDWSKLALSNLVIQSGTTADPTDVAAHGFTLKLNTFGTDGSTWDAGVSHVWTNFLTTTGGISNFLTDRFSFDTTGFHNADQTGTFSVQLNNNNLDLLYTVPEPGTWAMLLGGVGMLTFWQRSRRRNS